MSQWFLQRGERFYGPFTLDKVQGLLKSGRINDSTLVSKNKDGTNALPLAQLPQLSASVPSEPVREISTAANNDAWYLVDDAGEPRGPYQLAHLQKLLANGKVKPETRVKKKDSLQTIALKVLIPTAAPPEAAPQSTPRRRTAPKPSAPPRKKRLAPILIGLVVIAVLGAIGLALVPMDKGKDLGLIDKLESTIQQKPSLGKIIKERKGAAPPQYGSIVEKALRTGLNFKAEEVLRYNRKDLLIFDRRDGLEYSHLFNQTRREIRFSSDGGLNYTYLLDKDGYVFAVLTSGGNLDSHKLSKSSMADFSTTAMPPLELPDQTIWRAEITKGLIAKAVWRKRKNDERYLDYILVTSKEAEGRQ